MTHRLNVKALMCSSALLAALAVLGCSAYKLPPLSPRVKHLPDRISRAGLCSDESLNTVAGDLRSFEPAYELWSDGADKRRWIRLPPDGRIDTSDMDSWMFPIGTQLWKEFSHGNRRLETRLLTRVASDPDGWVGVAYVWNAEQTEAVARSDGVENVLGTAHDVPSARACTACHGGRSHRILGFSAIQLSHAPVSTDDLTLRRLTDEGLLSDLPTSPVRVPGNPTESQALGYLHSNCGSCHNSARPTDARFFKPPEDLDLWLQVASLSTPGVTTTYRTSIGSYVVPGSPSASQLFRCADGSRRFRRGMPPIATEILDAAGLRTLEQWIVGLRPSAQ